MMFHAYRGDIKMQTTSLVVDVANVVVGSRFVAVCRDRQLFAQNGDMP
jgi:hypothetical protein